MLDILLLIVLLISLVTDIKHRKILNIVTFPAIVIGVIYHIITNGWQGFLFSGNGFLLGFAFMFIPFLLGGMGAGDVKLMAAIGAMKGSLFTLYAFLYTSLIGGVIALVIIVARRQFASSMQRLTYAFTLRQANLLSQEELHHSFPYGVAIVLGTVTAMIWSGMQ